MQVIQLIINEKMVITVCLATQERQSTNNFASKHLNYI